MDTFEIHAKSTGKLEIKPTVEVKDREMLSQIYTPNVGKICMEIKDHPEKVKEFTIAGKTVAVISDGTAVLGFGDIGAKAALPVMEGKCVIFKEFAGLNAYPIVLEEKDPEKLIAIIKSLASNFAAINLEDIAAPKCFEIEQRLSDELDIPVVHDDQHGTAIVTLAALLGALKLTDKKELKVVISGAGAAGTAIAKLLLGAKEREMISIKELAMYDSKGLISTDREDLNKYKVEMAQLTTQNTFKTFEEGLIDADLFIGVSAPGILTPEMIKTMADKPIIFALANPTPEVMPDLALKAGAEIVATGRSDFNNQINNALAYPGVFKGLLEGKIQKVTQEHKLLAAKAIYEYNLPNLTRESLLPSILDKGVPELIAKTIMS